MSEQKRKLELRAKRDADLFKDFCRHFNKQIPVDVIYYKLENKYYLDKNSIYRIILRKSRIGKPG